MGAPKRRRPFLTVRKSKKARRTETVRLLICRFRKMSGRIFASLDTIYLPHNANYVVLGVRQRWV